MAGEDGGEVVLPFRLTGAVPVGAQARSVLCPMCFTVFCIPMDPELAAQVAVRPRKSPEKRKHE